MAKKKQLSDVSRFDDDALVVNEYNHFIGSILEWLDNDFVEVIEDIEEFVKGWSEYIDLFEEHGFDMTDCVEKYTTFKNKIHVLDRMYNELADTISRY